MLGLANPNHLQNPRPPTREIIKLISIKNTGGFDLEWITLQTSPRTLQNVTNLAKFCPPLKTHSQTSSDTSPILSNSVPLSKRTLRHSAIRHQSCQILSPLECWRAGHEDEDQSAQALNREKPAVRVFAYAVSKSANAKHPPWGSNPRPQG